MFATVPSVPTRDMTFESLHRTLSQTAANQANSSSFVVRIENSNRAVMTIVSVSFDELLTMIKSLNLPFSPSPHDTIDPATTG